MTIDFGVDLRCPATTEDADDLMSEITGVPLVVQDLRHRLLTDGVMGPGGIASGFNLRALLGMSTSALAGLQPKIVAVARRDDRIKDTPVVIITESNAAQLRTVKIDVSGKTALGPFKLVFNLAQTTVGAAIEILETAS